MNEIKTLEFHLKHIPSSVIEVREYTIKEIALNGLPSIFKTSDYEIVSILSWDREREEKEIQKKSERKRQEEIDNKTSCKYFVEYWDCDTIGCKLNGCGTYDFECGKGICKMYETK